MHKADFEKRVQEKMQELRLRPSDEVWKRVEEGIDGKRRPSAFFWVPAAVLIVGVIGYYSYNNFISPARLSDDKTNDKSFNKSNQPGQTIASKQNVPESKNDGSTKTIPLPLASSEKNTLEESDVRVSNNSSQKLATKGIKSSRATASQNSAQLRQPIVQPLIPDLIIAPPVTKRNIRYSSPVSDEQAAFIAGFAQQKLSSQNNLTSSQKVPLIPIEKRNNWEYELTFSAGLSNLTDGLLLSDSLRAWAYSSSGSGGGNNSPSGVKSGLSFSLGATANKWLGAKWNVGVGLQYQYFSNSMTIGEKIDSAIFVPQNNTSLSTVSGYYKSAGSTPYNTQYHFISLPLSVNWQFAPRFTWENQAAYSRLVYTNAMQYNGAYGVYYKDKNIVNKNQFMFATALKFGWNKNKFQVGPQLQYSSSNLFANSSRDSKHLYSLAIKANLKLSKN